MEVLFVAFIMSLSITTMFAYVSLKWMRRIMGYKGAFNIGLHIVAIFMFIGTSASALIAAEAAAIMLSIWIWAYSKIVGYSRYELLPKYKTDAITGETVYLTYKGWGSRAWVHTPGFFKIASDEMVPFYAPATPITKRAKRVRKEKVA